MAGISATDRAADRRLQRIYGRGLAWYNAQLKKQGGGCAICGRPPRKTRLAVDHNHAVARTKIVAVKTDGHWSARTIVDNCTHWEHGQTRAEAVTALRSKLKSMSVRGLLCMPCNRKILGSLERFKVPPANVIVYLQQYDPTNPLLGANDRQ